MTFKSLDHHFNTIITYSKESFASILNSLINIICFIRVGVKALLILHNLIWSTKIYNPSIFYLYDIGIGNFLFIKIIKNILIVE